MKYDGRQWLIKSLVGSHNYNLNTEESDKDYKVYVIPTFHDLYNWNKYQNCIDFNTETEDIAVHDIRSFVNMLYKANINFIEVLFSKELIINSDLPLSTYKMVEDIIKNREQYALMNLPYLYDACMGMYHQNSIKMKYINVTDDNEIVHLYNTKRAMTAFRMLDFLKRYMNNLCNPHINEPFKDAIRYDEHERKFMLKIRSGEFEIKVIDDMLASKLKDVEEIKNYYKEASPNEKLRLELEKDIKKIIYKNI